MSWKVDVLGADKIVRIKTAGSHATENIDRMTVEALEVGEKFGFARYSIYFSG